MYLQRLARFSLLLFDICSTVADNENNGDPPALPTASQNPQNPICKAS
jgi:hypothetical protein